MSEPEFSAVTGFFGGLAAELIKWFQIRHTLHTGLSDWSKSLLYWVVTFVMAVAGGGLVYLYAVSGTSLNPILALNVDASAPLLLEKLAQQAPTLSPGKSN